MPPRVRLRNCLNTREILLNSTTAQPRVARNKTKLQDILIYFLLCSCAKLAKDGGHRFFGVQDFRECWAGELTPKFFVSNPKAGECWGVRPNYEECIDNTKTKCVGRPYYNYIYEIISGI